MLESNFATGIPPFFHGVSGKACRRYEEKLFQSLICDKNNSQWAM